MKKEIEKIYNEVQRLRNMVSYYDEPDATHTDFIETLAKVHTNLNKLMDYINRFMACEHDWQPSEDNFLIDKCTKCGEERA